MSFQQFKFISYITLVCNKLVTVINYPHLKQCLLLMMINDILSSVRNSNYGRLAPTLLGNPVTCALWVYDLNLMKNNFFNSNFNDLIKSQFCTCHESSAVVTCANCDLILIWIPSHIFAVCIMSSLPVSETGMSNTPVACFYKKSSVNFFSVTIICRVKNAILFHYVDYLTFLLR